MSNTGNIGLFRFVSESSVAAGVRRVVGVTGLGVLALMDEKDALLTETAKELKAPNANDVAKRAAMLREEIKEVKRELESANAKLSQAQLSSLITSAKQCGKVRYLTAKLDMRADAARGVCDSIKADYPDMVAVFAIVNDGKLNFISCCGADAVKAGAHAGNILRDVSAVTGGKGGGRPDSAMSGGRDIDKIPEALAEVEKILASL